MWNRTERIAHTICKNMLKRLTAVFHETIQKRVCDNELFKKRAAFSDGNSASFTDRIYGLVCAFLYAGVGAQCGRDVSLA